MVEQRVVVPLARVQFPLATPFQIFYKTRMIYPSPTLPYVKGGSDWFPPLIIRGGEGVLFLRLILVSNDISLPNPPLC